MATESVGIVIKARDEASRKFGIIGKSSMSMASMIRKAAAMAAIYFGVRALKSWVEETLAAIDVTAKLSDRIGIATEDLIGLQHAAELTGVGAEGMNKAMDVLSKRLGEVKQGTGEGKTALKALGINIADIIKLGPYEQMLLIAEGFKKLQTQAERNAIASQLFSRANQKVVNLLQQGPDVIRAYRQEAEKLGLTFSRFDAAKIEQANDALYQLRSVFEGIKRTAVIELAPVIAAIATDFKDWAIEGEGLKSKVVGALESISLGLLETGGTISLVSAKWNTFTASIYETLAAYDRFLDRLTNLDELVAKTGYYRTFAEDADYFAAKADKHNQKAIDSLNKHIDLQIERNELEKRFASYQGAAGGGAGDAAGAKEREAAMKRQLAMLREVKGLIESTRSPVEQYEAQMARLLQLFAETGMGMGEFNKIAEQFRETAQRAFGIKPTALEQYERQIQRLHDALNFGIINWKQYGEAVRGAREQLERASKEKAEDSRKEFRQRLAPMKAGFLTFAPGKQFDRGVTYEQQTARNTGRQIGTLERIAKLLACQNKLFERTLHKERLSTQMQFASARLD